MFVVLGVVGFVNLCVGFFMGYLARHTQEASDALLTERDTYCHGYEDGFYLGNGEHDPELFRREIAEKAYEEYRGLRYGPTKH